MFTPDTIRQRHKKIVVNDLNVKTALGEIETQFSERAPTVLGGEYSAQLGTWLNEDERKAVANKLSEWGWHSIRIVQERRDESLIVYAKGV